MNEDNFIFNLLKKINLVVLAVTVLSLLISFFITNKDFWFYFPIFPYINPNTDNELLNEIFSSYNLTINIGFIMQLIMGVFAFMIYFSKKVLISFQFIHTITFLHAVLVSLIIDINHVSVEFTDAKMNIKMLNWFYAIFFLLLIVFNYFYDIKKAPKTGAFIQK